MRRLQPLLVLVVLLACKSEKPAGGASPSSSSPPTRVVHPLGCKTAEACVKALAATNGALRNAGLNGVSQFNTPTKPSEDQCNQMLWWLHRDEAILAAGEPAGTASELLPAACEVDDQALWTAVGAPHSWCDQLQKCAEGMKAAFGADAETDAAALLEVSTVARAKGWSGELVCQKTRRASYRNWSSREGLPRECYLDP